MHHSAGIDISKNRLDLCVLDETGEIVLEEQLSNNDAGYDELAELVDPATPIGLEVGTLAYPCTISWLSGATRSGLGIPSG